MCKSTVVTVALSFCILLVILTLTGCAVGSASSDDATAVRIEITDTKVTGRHLEIEYRIINGSEDDAWIYVGGGLQFSDGTFGMAAGLHLTEDGRTLTIRGRAFARKSLRTHMPGYKRFVRLLPGATQTESVFFKMPAHPYSLTERQRGQGLKYASRLAIELGYYTGNLPEEILEMSEEQAKTSHGDLREGALRPNNFSNWNQVVTSRDEELLLPSYSRVFKGESEQILRAVVEDVHIPYEATRLYYPPRIEPPALASCTKVELRYQPSMLEYFFPFAFQQSLLSPMELEYLQAQKTLVLEDAQDIRVFAEDIGKARTSDGRVLVRYRGHVDVACYHDGKPTQSFPICNDDVVIVEREPLSWLEGFPSLKTLTPQIEAIDLRMRCATNLKNQWYRFRFHYIYEAYDRDVSAGKIEKIFPAPRKWCDTMVGPNPTRPICGIPRFRSLSKKPHICPSASEGRNHYALNPNCKPDSPSDMVLLFETKAGWNQHGGPELFTFDNHDPKGGCVLLNDGTVNFIRTAEELRQLRWE
ncbi:MAG: hypothetical protein ACYS0H_18260 [Planctomycetota bacterium]